jgi:hypothetical protein
MDSQRFSKILQETVSNLNLIAYTLNSYLWEIEKSHVFSPSLSAIKGLEQENKELKAQLKELRKSIT